MGTFVVENHCKLGVQSDDAGLTVSCAVHAVHLRKLINLLYAARGCESDP